MKYLAYANTKMRRIHDEADKIMEKLGIRQPTANDYITNNLSHINKYMALHEFLVKNIANSQDKPKPIKRRNSI